MKNYIDDFKNIEKEFFEIDETEKLAKVNLHFDKVSDILDKNYLSKTPVFSDEFNDWILSALNLIPSKYKIDLKISFDDYENYDKDELNKVFGKNILLDAKSKLSEVKSRNKIGFIFMGMGFFFLISMILITHLWTSEGLLKTIFSYVADILATVTFWEALSILVLQGRERRLEYKNLMRFLSVKII